MTRPIRRPRLPGVLGRLEGRSGRATAVGFPGGDAPASIQASEVAELRARLADTVEQVTRLVGENAELASAHAALEAANGELTAARDALRKQLDQREGEVKVLRARLREEVRDRDERVQRVDQLERELSELASDVLAADVTRQRRGLLRRTPKAPSPRASARGSSPGERAPAGAATAADVREDLDTALERRLFGL